MNSIKGIIVPILTPMRENESVDDEKLRNEIEWLLSAGVHGIFPCGTSGEGYILSDDEKNHILSVCVDQVNGRVPVYAGTGMISTRDTIRMSRKAADLGADVLSVITPSFAMASQEELYEHYREIAENVDKPVLLYNIPARTGNSLSPDTVEKLSRIDNIAGIKDSSGNFDNILQYIEKTRDQDFTVLSGNDSLVLWTLMAGGKGGISGCANVFPQNMVSIYQYFMNGDIEKARKAQDAVRPLRNCFRYGNSNAVIKKAVQYLGYDMGKCRKPFHILSPECLKVLEKVMNELLKEGLK